MSQVRFTQGAQLPTLGWQEQGALVSLSEELAEQAVGLGLAVFEDLETAPESTTGEIDTQPKTAADNVTAAAPGKPRFGRNR